MKIDAMYVTESLNLTLVFHYSNCDYGDFNCSEPERCYFCGEYYGFLLPVN